MSTFASGLSTALEGLLNVALLTPPELASPTATDPKTGLTFEEPRAALARAGQRLTKQAQPATTPATAPAGDDTVRRGALPGETNVPGGRPVTPDETTAEPTTETTTPATAPATTTAAESPMLTRLRERIERERLRRELAEETRKTRDAEIEVTPFNRARRAINENRPALTTAGKDAFDRALVAGQLAGMNDTQARRFAQEKMRQAREAFIKDLLGGVTEELPDPNNPDQTITNRPFVNPDTGRVAIPRPRPTPTRTELGSLLRRDITPPDFAAAEEFGRQFRRTTQQRRAGRLQERGISTFSPEDFGAAVSGTATPTNQALDELLSGRLSVSPTVADLLGLSRIA